MPPVNYPPAGVLWAKLKDLQNQLTALQNQQTVGVVNSSGQTAVQTGKQLDNTYGISVLGPNGVMQKVGGVGHSYVAAEQTYDSTTWGSLATIDPVVDVVLGPSGICLVAMSAFIEPGSYGSGETAAVGVSIDGGTPNSNPTVFAEVGASSLTGFTSSALYIQALQPGPHTFQLQYKVSTDGVVANFAIRSLVVIPY